MERSSQRLGWIGLAPVLACLASAALAQAQATSPSVQSTIEALRAHDFSRALEMTQALAREHPDDARVWTLQGSALFALGRGEESLRSYQQALTIRPEYLPALEGAAQCEYADGNPAAQNLLDRIIGIDPSNEIAQAMLASLSFKQNQCDKAVAHFALAGKALANNPQALAEYGICLTHDHQLARAEPVFRSLLDLRPYDWHNRYNLGLLQYLTGRNATAIETLKPIVEGGAAQVDALNLVAAAYEANHETPAATEALRRAIDLAPRDVRNYLDLATLCMDHAAFQVGVDIAGAGLNQIPDSAALYTERGVLNAQLMKYDDADADFAKANQLQPRQEFATVGLGISLLERNDSERSLNLLRSRLKDSPDEPTLNYLVAETLMRRGAAPGTPEFNEAEAAARRAVKAKADFAPAHDVLSRLYLRAGDAARAVTESRLALKFDPTDRTAIFHLISALRASGDKSEIVTLTARLRDLAAAETRNDAERSRFRIVEAEPANARP
jgi:tetratricopeptide (TPR) repeat protein